MIHLDKLLHFAAGALAALAAGLLVSPPVGVAAAVFVGAVKEAYDATGRGTPDGLDFIATVVGGLTATVLVATI